MGWKREEELKRQTAVKVIAGLWFGLTLILLYLNMGGSSFTASGTSEFYSRPPDDIQLIKCSTSAIDWTVHRPESITLPHVIEYVEWTNSSSCRLSHDFGGHIHDLGVDGQKAVCMDPEVRPESGKCLVYSFGIAHDWTFDEAIEEFGCEVTLKHLILLSMKAINGSCYHRYLPLIQRQAKRTTITARKSTSGTWDWEAGTRFGTDRQPDSIGRYALWIPSTDN